MLFKRGNARGQVTIFIIIAIVIVGAVAGFFVVRNYIGVEKLSPNIEPVYTTFLSCLESDVLTGIDVLESQGGYISLPAYEPGSPYMPFSSQLDFLGNPIPYWYYVSGNNIQKEQVPTKSEMEEQLAGFVDGKIRNCLFDSYYEQGFEISIAEPNADVTINDKNVVVNLNAEMQITKGDESAVIGSHKIEVKSELGSLYKSAKEIYDLEQRDLFLENYAIDTMRLYAPVDGVELSCSPKTWNADEVFEELRTAIEANTNSLKTKGNEYTLRNKDNEYFVIDLDAGNEVKFVNSRNWSYGFEVNPSEGNVLISKPVGNQPGLGVLGFCYIPYHFVYNIRYPVLVQVFSGEEIFQFPVAVVVQGNNPREALDTSAIEMPAPELCEYKNTLTSVSTYDTSLNPIEAEISYACLGQTCVIGKTNLESPLVEEFPQCVNGYIVAKAEGFEDSRYLYSTIEEGSAEIIMDKLYEMNIALKLDGKSYSGEAIISFGSEKSSKTVVYPAQRSVELSEGQYEVQVWIYKNSSIQFAESTKEQCMETPRSGLGGLFGLTEEKCFEIKIPAQIISNALSGGGKQEHYILESQLQDSSTIEINAGSLPTPTSIETLQTNYIIFEDKGLDITLE